MSRLDEQQRRWFAALKSKKVGYGGDTLFSLITGLHVDTIRRGRDELDAQLQGRPSDSIRRPGAGRPPRESVKASAARAGRLVWPGSEGLPPPAWGEQVQSGGAPSVQSDQPELGGDAAADASVDLDALAWDADDSGVAGDGRVEHRAS
jgi:hypothetical protein